MYTNLTHIYYYKSTTTNIYYKYLTHIYFQTYFQTYFQIYYTKYTYLLHTHIAYTYKKPFCTYTVVLGYLFLI